jgi:hypothetical protein
MIDATLQNYYKQEKKDRKAGESSIPCGWCGDPSIRWTAEDSACEKHMVNLRIRESLKSQSDRVSQILIALGHANNNCDIEVERAKQTKRLLFLLEQENWQL